MSKETVDIFYRTLITGCYAENSPNQDQMPGKPAVQWVDWTIFITTPDGTDPSDLIEKVAFCIHSDFSPNQRCVTAYPFEISEHGHGFFSATARIYFRCPNVNPVDVVIPVRWDSSLPSLIINATAVTFAGIPQDDARKSVFQATPLSVTRMAASSVPQEMLVMAIQELLDDESGVQSMKEICAKLRNEIMDVRKKIAAIQEKRGPPSLG